MLEWRLEPAARPLERLAEQARVLAQRLGKDAIDVRVEAGDVRLDPARYRQFFSELVHVVCNAVDHGIPEERAQRAKPRSGQLTLGVKEEGGALVFQVSDDGRGIDWGPIRAKAAELGLPHEGPAALLDALCHDGITTRAGVTETSGRGVGMAAFKACVERMNGHIDLKSSALGTHWYISFPSRTPRAPSQHPGTAQAGAPRGSTAALG